MATASRPPVSAQPGVVHARSIQYESAHSVATEMTTPAQGWPNRVQPSARISPWPMGKVEL